VLNIPKLLRKVRKVAQEERFFGFVAGRAKKRAGNHVSGHFAQND
jgi:hypothetical protein